MSKSRLQKETVFLLESIIIFTENDTNNSIDFRPAQIKRLIKILENPEVIKLKNSLKKQHSHYIQGIQKLMRNVKSKDLINNNPWYKLGTLANNMVWGQEPYLTDKNELDIWHKINGFCFKNGILEDIRLKVLLMILIEFDQFGLEKIASYLPILFTEPVYISTVSGLPTIQIKEKLTYGQLMDWLKKNKKTVEYVFKTYNWRDTTRRSFNLIRDIKILLMWHNGTKDLSIARKYNISTQRVHQTLNDLVRLNK